MDPLSIASIVVKLTATCLSTAKTLSAIRSEYKDAPISLVSICSEAAVISACLSRLQMIVCEKQDLVQVLESRAELNFALDVALTGCVVLFSCLDDEIRNITSEASPTTAGAIKWKEKAKVVWNREKLRDLLDGLRGQQVAINLLIQLVQLESIAEIKQLLGQKSHVLSESIRRTQSLKQSNPSISFPASIYSRDDRQSVSSNAPSTSGASRFNFEFDDLLINSKVYRQVLASARAKLAEPDGKVEGSSVDPPDSQTIISAQTKYLTRDLKSWGFSKHEQPLDTVSASIMPRTAIEDNYLREYGQGNVNREEAQISRKPIVNQEVIQVNSANDSNSFDKKLLGTNGPSNNKNSGERPKSLAILVPRDYEFRRNIHHCARCDVELCQNLTNFQIYAVKLIKHDSGSRFREGYISPQVASAYGEIAIIHKLNHPNIISLVEVLKLPSSIGLVLSYVQSMSSYIKASHHLKEASAKRLFAQIISGVEHLHKGGIVHRNLHPENLLLNDHLNILISGFSQAYIIDPAIDLVIKKDYFNYNPGFRHSVKGADPFLLSFGEKKRTGLNMNIARSLNPVYTAPEVLLDLLTNMPSQMDVWSCGVILYKMLAGHLPFASSTKLATIVDDDENPSLQKLIPSKKPFLFSKNMRLDARTLISSMLRVNPLDRADLEEVVCHRWMCDERELTTDTPLPG